MNVKQTVKGFTIIEVVLVLAIAGLIFLMVFVALPALQASQRDGARKNDVSAVAAAVNSYASANKGSFPTTDKLKDYASNVSTNTTDISIVARPASNSVTVTDGQIIVVTGATCDATGAATTSGGSKSATQTVATGTARQYVVITLLEAGKGTSFCQGS